MANTISTRIALEGVLDIIRQLRDMGHAGEEAIEKIKAATSGGVNVNVSTKELGEAKKAIDELHGSNSRLVDGITAAALTLNRYTRSFGEMRGVIAALAPELKKIGEIGAIVGGLTLFGKLAIDAAQATRELQNQAATLGLTREAFEGLKMAANAAGVSQEGFTRGLDRFVANVGRAREESSALAAKEQVAADKLAESQKRVDDAVSNTSLTADRMALSFARASAAINAADRGVEQAKNNLAKANRELQQLNSGTAGAAENLKRAQRELDELLNPPNEEQKRERRVNEARERVDNAKRELDQAKKDAQERVKLAREELAERQFAAQAARAQAAQEAKQLQQDRHKAYEAEQAAAKAHYKAMEEMAAEGAANVTRANQGMSKAFRDIAESGGGEEETLERFKRFADLIRSLATAEERANEARRVFGRGWAEQMPLLIQGAEGIQKLIDATKDYAVSATDAEVKMAGAFNIAWTQFKSALEGIRNAVGNIFGQVMTPVIKALADFIKENATQIREWMQSFVNFLEVVGRVLLRVGDALLLVKSVADTVAAAITKISNTNISGGELLASLATAYLAWKMFGGAVVAAAATLFPLVEVAGAASVAIGVGGLAGSVSRLGGLFLVLLRNIVGTKGEIALLILALGELYKLLSDTSAMQKATDGFVKLAKSIMDVGVAETYRRLSSGKASAGSPGGPAATSTGQELTKSQEQDEGLVRNPDGSLTRRQGGGPIPGSGSGDHVHILAEPGEYMVQKTAVQQLGTAFFDAINSGSLPRFALGGLIGRMLNVNPAPLAFAGGGMIPSSGTNDKTPIHLSLEGRTYEMSAPSQTADKLLEHARTSAIVSLGPKPSHYGRG